MMDTPLFFQLFHYFKKAVCFPFRQGSGRFIHDDSLGIQHKASGDFRHLLLAYGAFPRDFIQGQINVRIFLAFCFGQFHALFFGNQWYQILFSAGS